MPLPFEERPIFIGLKARTTLNKPKEDRMDKSWLYIGAIMLGLIVVSVIVLKAVRSAVPAADDLRSAYEREVNLRK
jgi:hypothetical protein